MHGFSYEFRNIYCLQHSATQDSCSSFHHQIISIFSHSNNTTTPHSFPLLPIICYFLTLPLEHMEQRHKISWRQCKTHGQYSINNSIGDRSPPFHMESQSYGMNDSESHNAEPLKILQAHGQYSQNNSMDDRSPPFHMESKSPGMNDSGSHNAGPTIYRKLPGTPGTPGTGQLFIYFS